MSSHTKLSSRAIRARMHKTFIACATLVFSGATLGIATAFVHAAPIDPDLDQTSPSDYFAKKIGEATGAQLGTNADQELPVALAAAMKAVLSPTIKTPTFNLDVQLRSMRQEAADFDAAWDKVQARKRDVDSALEAANKAKASGDMASARDALRAVISPMPSKWPTSSTSSIQYQLQMGHGFTPRQLVDTIKETSFLIPEDAEFEAVQALVALSVGQGDYAAAGEACFVETQRRHVRAEPDERLMWLSRSRTYRDLTGTAHKTAAIASALGQINSYQSSRVISVLDAVAHGCLRDALAQGKVATTDLPSLAKAKKGDWVAVALTATKWSATGPHYIEHRKGSTPYNCRNSDHIAAITLDGHVIWEQKCDWKPYTVDVDVDVVLAQPPAEQPSGQLLVVGQITRAGAKTQLGKATLVPTFFDRDIATEQH